VDVKPALVVPRSEHSDGIAGDRRQSWAFGQRPPIGAKKSQFAVGLSFDLIAVFVDCTVMPTTQHREIRQSRRASVSPVAEVMTLAEP
jgi:hypothetical protein